MDQQDAVEGDHVVVQFQRAFSRMVEVVTLASNVYNMMEILDHDVPKPGQRTYEL